MTIASEGAVTGPLTQQLQQTLDNYKSIAVVQLAIAPLPYNPSTDAKREDLQVRAAGRGSFLCAEGQQP
jgi:hypothetical protein